MIFFFFNISCLILKITFKVENELKYRFLKKNDIPSKKVKNLYFQIFNQDLSVINLIYVKF